MPKPSLTRFDVADPVGVVLVLHGGQQNSKGLVERRHASFWRMALMQRSVARVTRVEQVGVWLLRYRYRGWNASGHADPDPVQDAHWALAQIRVAYPSVPIALLGHSMGGRTACAVADADDVVGVTALAPWLPQDEPITAVIGRPLVIAHGSRDRWTSPFWSRDFATRVRGSGSPVAYHSMGPVGHFMLRRSRRWNQVAAQNTLGMLAVGAAADRFAPGSAL